MNPELRRRKRWFRALEIAKYLFEDEGYHTLYLQDIQEVLKGENGMYSPKISEELIPKLFRKAKTENVPMTVLVNKIIGEALDGKGEEKRGKGGGDEEE